MRLIVAFFILVVLIGCGDSTAPEERNVEIIEVGKLKTPQKHRFYTFHLKTNMDAERTQDFQQLKQAVEKHGSELRNTTGKETWGFYFTNRDQIPTMENGNVSEESNGFQRLVRLEAIRRNMIKHQPLFVTHIDRKGQFELIEEPVNEQ